MDIYISPKKILRLLGFIVVCLVVVSVAGIGVRYLIGDFYLEHILQRLTDLDQPFSLTTWYSSSILFLCSLLLLIITFAEYPVWYPYKGHWFFLGVIFLLLSLDKSTEIHHSIRHDLLYRLPESIDISDLWLISLVCFALIIFCFSYKTFFCHLPVKTKRLFLIAGLIFAAGTLGVDAIDNHFFQVDGAILLAHNLALVIEEFFEMSGVTVLVYALISYISLYANDINIIFKHGSKNYRQSEKALEIGKRIRN